MRGRKHGPGHQCQSLVLEMLALNIVQEVDAIHLETQIYERCLETGGGAGLFFQQREHSQLGHEIHPLSLPS